MRGGVPHTCVHEGSLLSKLDTVCTNQVDFCKNSDDDKDLDGKVSTCDATRYLAVRATGLLLSTIASIQVMARMFTDFECGVSELTVNSNWRSWLSKLLYVAFSSAVNGLP